MSKLRSLILAGALVASIVAPVTAQADPVVTNPFGSLTGVVISVPNGTDPGVVRLTVHVKDDPNSITGSGTPVYFGLRIMAGEDVQLRDFSIPNKSAGCIVSDFAGNFTSGKWQGAPVFGAGEGATPLDSLNAHMRMIGGYIKSACGNLAIDVSFVAHPFVAFYAAFFGTGPAPWHNGYKTLPWSLLTTGGDYAEWWNLWGQFDTLGYSNACTLVSANRGEAC